MSPRRQAMNRRLWSSVRTLPGGEQAMRDMVADLRREDRSGRDLLGTEDYCSTKLLSDAQFERLLERVEERSKPIRRRSSTGKSVVWIITQKERGYIRFMAGALGWTKPALDTFVARQTKERGLKTHDLASACIEPMERLLEERGWLRRETHGRKWWDPPDVIVQEMSG